MPGTPSAASFSATCLGRRRGWRFDLVRALGPGAVISDRGHQRYSDDTDHDLHPDRAGNFDQRDVGSYSEEDADAEHLERLLAALDQRPEHRPLKPRPVTR